MTIYLDDVDHRRFLRILSEVVRERTIDCHAYCLMTNHYHLVITTHEANISAALKQLNGEYAQWWNRRHERVGHAFQGRFGAKVVQDGEYLLRACRYAVLNPVRANVVSRPEQWPWGSYRSTAGLAPVPPFLRCEVIWRAVGGDCRQKQMEAYRQFILTPDPDAGKLLRKAVVGDPEFVMNFQKWRDAASREVPQRERRIRPDLETVFGGAVTRHQQCAAAARAKDGGYEYREIAAYLEVNRSTARRMVARGQVCRMEHPQT